MCRWLYVMNGSTISRWRSCFEGRGEQIRERIPNEKGRRRIYLSILMATKFNIEAVLKVTSKAIQKSQIVSLNSHTPLTCGASSLSIDCHCHPLPGPKDRVRWSMTQQSLEHSSGWWSQSWKFDDDAPSQWREKWKGEEKERKKFDEVSWRKRVNLKFSVNRNVKWESATF